MVMVERLSNFVFSGKFSRISAVEVPWELLSKKDLESSQVAYIRAALRLILNATKPKISPYGTRDRSKDVTITFSFAILPLLSSLCREKCPLSNQQIVSV